jgi:prepilin-type N-terminal cleavage/methylation domain-containing protein
MRNHGFSITEMMVVMAIAAVLLSVAIPSFTQSLTNSRLQAVAESIQSGLLRARSEAINRNAPIRFQLVSDLTSACTLTNTKGFWLVTQYTTVTTPANTRGIPTGACHIKEYVPADQEEPCPATPAYSGNAATCQADPFIAYRSAADTVANVDVVATPTTGGAAEFMMTFGPLGQLLPSLEGAIPSASATGVTYEVLVSPTAPLTGRSWKVQVSSNGGVKLCDPGVDAANTLACL